MPRIFCPFSNDLLHSTAKGVCHALVFIDAVGSVIEFPLVPAGLIDNLNLHRGSLNTPLSP